MSSSVWTEVGAEPSTGKLTQVRLERHGNRRCELCIWKCGCAVHICGRKRFRAGHRFTSSHSILAEFESQESCKCAHNIEMSPNLDWRCASLCTYWQASQTTSQLLDEKFQFVENLKTLPVAINTSEANEQHYEVQDHPQPEHFNSSVLVTCMRIRALISFDKPSSWRFKIMMYHAPIRVDWVSVMSLLACMTLCVYILLAEVSLQWSS
jgi:hypothetical protein